MAPISVLVADSQRLFVDAVSVALGHYPELAVVEERPTTAVEAIRAAARRRPDVALVDCQLPGMHAGAVTSAILARSPDTT